ncbi:flavodoxin [Pseudomonas sp. CCM 7891]|uniref:Flavodoxin n=1 Tax=Pseudomonas karstica TaxID=1055468 RepID=A0A7X2UXR6_9PSED|nr:flavodoxin [Pseudomonas karstica]MTD19349.1 flavodoxin [Pseudomonas karstica]
MNEQHDPVRRAVMMALAALPLSRTSSVLADSAVRQTGSRTLVAYFSRSGSTRVVAGLIQRALGTDLFEIRPAAAYPEDYLKTVEQARQERDAGYEPPLEAMISNMTLYDTVFLGFPIWGETTPPVIRAFMSEHDLSGKTLIPFITHGGYGLGSSHTVLASHAPKARLSKGFAMEADQERQTMNRVESWLSTVKSNV